MYVYVESQVIADDVKPGFVNFSVYTEFWMGNVDISLSRARI